MDLLISILTSAFWVILAITILVFIHELGHFLTAKWFGMRVERFSIGFPPKLFGRSYRGTEYVVGATPLGGYVKISGMIDESLDTEYQQSEPEPWEFRSKPVWQRIVVITAGVVFNVILAVFIFGGINWAQGDVFVPAQKIESVHVDDGSLAHDMGLRTGDRIVAVNGRDFERLNQLDPNALVKADTLTITVERSGERVTVQGPPDFMTRMSRAQRESNGAGGPLGIHLAPSIVTGVSEDFPAGKAGLRPYDRIVGLEADSITHWSQLADRIAASEGRPLTVRWFRADSLLSEEIDAVPLARASRATSADASDEPPVSNATAADTSTVRTASTVGADSLANPPQLLRRTPDGAVFQNIIAATKQDDRFIFGIRGMSPDALTEIYGAEIRTYGPLEAVVVGVEDTWDWGVTIVVSLKRIATGRDDVRENLGGPVAIAQVTSQAAQSGAIPFWRIVAVLSITLAIMNILPIPALDGGQLMFLLYEGITRRRPSVRVRLVAQQVGMVFLLGFMAFLIFNDILRTMG